MIDTIGLAIGVILVILFFLAGIRIVRPTQRGLIERLGKYRDFSDQGFHWIIPVIDRMIRVNITEQMIDAEKQEIITKDRLNASVDAQVYFKVKPIETDVKKSQYNVDDYEYQIVNLCKTTLRNIIGTMSYDDANSKRDVINGKLQGILTKEAQPWGIEIIRTEIKEIGPTEDVQNSMNEVIKAENTKKANRDLAEAAEIKADGERRAAIKEADGEKQSKILVATGEAKAIELVNVAARKFFVGNAQTLKKLEVTENSLKRVSKYVIDSRSNLVNVMSEVANVTPIPKTSKK